MLPKTVTYDLGASAVIVISHTENRWKVEFTETIYMVEDRRPGNKFSGVKYFETYEYADTFAQRVANFYKAMRSHRYNAEREAQLEEELKWIRQITNNQKDRMKEDIKRWFD